MRAGDWMTERELRIVQECLDAAVHGPFFEDWEFQTLTGCTREEIAAIADAWPGEVDEEAVQSVLGNLTGYPHGRPLAWRRLISATPEEVGRLDDAWRAVGDT
ncbi:hypothetical protein GCM10020229_02590 [Kitasatospora albolonga]|uniref:hypothetical protein n=1 Tax=Kitasatospora albolonga TaxID=68173 RepID=UPI0031E97C4E